MTEAEWLACDHPAPMLIHLRGEVSGQERADSKSRLHGGGGELFDGPSPIVPAGRFTRFMTAYADWLRERPLEEEYRRSLEEDFDSWAAITPLGVGQACWRLGAGVAREEAKESVSLTCAGATEDDRFLWAFSGGPPDPLYQTTLAEEGRRQAELLREVVGNPFRPVAFSLAWDNPVVATLAQAADEERELPSGHLDNARLGVLSDALEEAGCTDDGILAHLRSPGHHVRGCWALDLVLGKE